MQECPYCHHHNRGNAQFCAGCGNSLHPSSAKDYVALQSGQILRGIYRVVRPLGKGGMGAVYLVEDQGAFDRKRVIKEMLRYFDLTDPQATKKAQKRFEDEGRVLAQLRHHGIPDIISYFSEGGRNYIVMEYVEGDNLLQGLTHADAQGNVVRGKPYPLENVLSWGLQLCDVLIYLAQQKPPVVHHDIKPANIIIDKNTDEARLVDFGTAKARLTRFGGSVGVQKSSIYGTDGYAAPEMYPPNQTSNSRSDVYSLATTLYHLLTDDDPRDHPFDFPKLDTLDPAIQKVLQEALQDDPKQRPSAQAFRQALQDVQAALLGEVKAPFVFPGGQRARTPSELAHLCDQHWDIAKKLFYDGDFERWLRHALFRADLADEASNIAQAGGDRDEGLETFLHILDSRLPYPALRLRPRRLGFGRIAPGEAAKRKLHIRNKAGRGPLKGSIKVTPPVPWLTAPTRFAGESEIELEIDASGKKDGESLKTSLMFETPYEERTIPVHGRVAFPWQKALGRIGLGLLIGGLIGGYLAFLGMSQPGTSQTYIGLGAMALLLAVWRVRRAQASWKGKTLRLLLYTLLLGAILLALNRWAYNLWHIVRRADVVGGWALPTAAGAIAGLAVGVIKALSRPGHRLIPWLAAATILLGSGAYGIWKSYPLLNIWAALPTPIPTEASATMPRPTVTPKHSSPTKPVAIGEVHIGAEVKIVTDGRRLNIRQAPSTGADIVTRGEFGEQLVVVGGPRTADGYTWWRVELPDGTIGWAIERCLKPMR